jgi:hypothetical protein
MFWSEQAISNHDEQPHIINNKTLDSDKWVTPSGYKLVDLSELKAEEIVEFIRLNNNIGGDTTTLLDTKSIEWLKEWPSEWVGIKNNNNELIAFNFVIFFQCHLGNEIAQVGHTVYLCVHPDERKKGFASVCIRETMRRGTIRSKPTYIGYHQSDKPIGKNSILIKSWFRPLNHRKCRQLGMLIPRKGSHSQIRKFYSVDSPGDEFDWKELSDENKVNLSLIIERYPVRPVWKDFIDFFTKSDFTLRVIYLKAAPIGYVCYRNWPIYFKTPNKVAYVALIEFFFGSRDALQYVLYELAKENYPFAYFHQTGFITESLLKSINAILAGLRSINWYNWTGTYTERDILLPLY